MYRSRRRIKFYRKREKVAFKDILYNSHIVGALMLTEAVPVLKNKPLTHFLLKKKYTELKSRYK